MRCRLVAVLASVATVVLLPSAAGADAVVSYRSPAPDAMVTEPAQLLVDVERRLIDPHPEQVTLRLSRDGAEPLADGAAVDLECVEGCDGGASETTSSWTGPTLDPTTLAPFETAPVCNGRWWLVADVTPGPTRSPGQGHGSFLVSQPGSAVSDLAVQVQGRDVVLSWRGAPEEDVHGYRVERRSGGAWQSIAKLAASTVSFRHGPVADGEYHYRVVTLRADGFADGEPTVACADSGADLETPSDAWKVRMSSTGADVAPTGGQTGGTGGSGTGTGGPAEEGAQPDDGTAQGSDHEDASRAETSSAGSGSARQRIAGAGDDDDAMSAPGVATAAGGAGDRERYFGEDGPFDDRLDYAGVDALSGEADPEYATQRVPGGVIEVFDRELDLAHTLPPVATGLLLVAIGLHLRRWTRT